MSARKILIVEDEAPMQRLLSDELVARGMEVANALDGESGLDMALKTHPDLILLDLILPVMDGFALLKKLRADGWGRNARVIILSNLSDKKRFEEARALGVPQYLLKSQTETKAVAQKIVETLSLAA